MADGPRGLSEVTEAALRDVGQLPSFRALFHIEPLPDERGVRVKYDDTLVFVEDDPSFDLKLTQLRSILHHASRRAGELHDFLTDRGDEAEWGRRPGYSSAVRLAATIRDTHDNMVRLLTGVGVEEDVFPSLVEALHDSMKVEAAAKVEPMEPYEPDVPTEAKLREAEIYGRIKALQERIRTRKDMPDARICQELQNILDYIKE